MTLNRSCVDEVTFHQHKFYIKRDDKIHKYLSGNKYRKLHTLINTQASKLNTVISYGGLQSNAMLSMAYMCYKKGWEFLYYVKRVPSNLVNNPSSNYKKALEFNTKFIEVDESKYDSEIDRIKNLKDEKLFVINQGGAQIEAEDGVKVLADELKEFIKDKSIAIVTPSGTGTTAYFLAKNLPHVDVYTTPCVANESYLKEQMSLLGDELSNLHVINTTKKYHFAKPYKEFYQTYKELIKQTGIEFDLIYAPKTWLALLENISKIDKDILYVHSGGVLGNESMIERYMYKRLI
ncbi:MAG: pyridoxal-phosphate dependent enzyme [Campylobacterota bacterium]|nr:pyridoxal-phosphate dependent enzyme [Campylobacterota bacterium]